MSMDRRWPAAWVVAIGTLCAVATALAAHLTPRWEIRIVPVVLGVILAVVMFLHGMREDIYGIAALVRLTFCAFCGVWATLAAWKGLSLRLGVTMLVAAVAVALALHLMPYTVPVYQIPEPGGPVRDGRPQPVREWESALRRLLNKPVVVIEVTPWEKPSDGLQVRVQLDDASGMTWKDLHAVTDRIAAAKRLPIGCAVRVLDGQHQGEALLDVMLRDCLADTVTIDEPTTETTINEPFEVMASPRGEALDVCLREQSMVVGGFVGAGKTTLLHRIIMRLARCVDVLIWVIDMNGGGLAWPWIEPWATGKAGRPVVDWVASNDEEAAVMVAVGAAIAKDRKASPVARARKAKGNTQVLPVDKHLPAIMIIVDEGGEVRQKLSVVGQLAARGITQLAQIGRAEAVRLVLSVLRGTSDILDKGFRTQAAVRVCLQMAEEVDYDHVLGTNPGGARLIHKGSGWLYRTADLKPVFGRTVNVLLSHIDAHAIATAGLRPDLDERGQQVAAAVRLNDVLGRPVDSGELRDYVRSMPVMRDVQAGRAYTARWDRLAVVLAEMRGEEVPEQPQPVELDTPPARSASPALADLLQAGHRARQAAGPTVTSDVDETARELISQLDWPDESTTRGRIQVILAQANGEALRPAQIVERLAREGNEVSRQRVQELLTEEKKAGRVMQIASGGYTLPEA